ncbi:MAG: SCP2 sterol-binding domain-containing protein [Candidatus Thorarchaeota archaeon]
MSEPWKNKVPFATLLLNIFGYLSLVPLIVLSIYGQYEMAIISGLFLSVVSTTLCKKYSVVKVTDLVFLGFFLGSSLLLLFPLWTSIISAYYNAMLWFILALMSGISILVKRPFTLEYAKQRVSESVWATPQFYRINQLITMVFFLVFGTDTVISILIDDRLIRYVLAFSLLGVALAAPSIVPKLYVQIGFKEDSSPQSDVDMSRMSIEEIFSGMVERFNPGAAEGLKAVLQFSVTGLQSGEFFIDIKNSTATLVRGVDTSPDLLVEIDSEDWVAIVEGRLDGTQAYMTGKMKVKGDMNLMFILEQLFPTMSSKQDNCHTEQDHPDNWNLPGLQQGPQ